MIFFYNIFLFIILIFYSKEDDKVVVTITATSGIIKKAINEKTKILSFIIPCKVDKNITNKISMIDITIKTKRPEDNKIFPSICNLQLIRLELDDDHANTQLNCKFDYNNYENDNITENMKLIIEENPSYTSTIADFVFADFDKIGIPIEIGGLFIYNLESDFCHDNNFFFEMNFTSINGPPLESTICNFIISNNEVHDKVKCAIPYSSNVIKCVIDVSEEKIEKEEEIQIKAQAYSECENGQVVTIVNDAKNILILDEECNEGTNLFFDIKKIFFFFLIIFSY